MKRLKFLATGLSILFIMSSVLTSCGQEVQVEGGDLIKSAREAYAELDSAKVIMTNMETGEVDQTFTFKYDEKDILTYCYDGKNGDDIYAQYNNGVEMYTYQNGEYSTSVKGDKGFVAYSKDSKHPQADEGLIMMSAAAVKNATVAEKSGYIVVTHEYDMDKISPDIDEGEATAFTAEYYFDKDNNLVYFTETTDIKLDGEAKKYAYKIEITHRNAVDKVENSVLQYADDK